MNKFTLVNTEVSCYLAYLMKSKGAHILQRPLKL